MRVLAATNRNLEQMVDDGRFRKDLYYRLKVVAAEIPPLRRRREDVLPLAREFITTSCAAHGIPLKTLARKRLGAGGAMTRGRCGRSS